MAEFVEADGLVHVVSPISGGEHTICGDAFDLASEEVGYEWRATKKRLVTCQQCAAVVRDLRHVRTQQQDPTHDR